MTTFILTPMYVKPTPKGHRRKYTTNYNERGKRVIRIQTPDGEPLPEEVDDMFSSQTLEETNAGSSETDNWFWVLNLEHRWIDNLINRFEEAGFDYVEKIGDEYWVGNTEMDFEMFPM